MRQLTNVDMISVGEAYNASDRRLILFDFEGTLIPSGFTPEKERPNEVLIETLEMLEEDSRNDVVVISGSTKEELDRLFGSPSFLIVAEHGGFYKSPYGTWKQTFMIDPDWIENVSRSVGELADQHEGSLLERKHFSVALHHCTSPVTICDHAQILDEIRALPEHGKFVIDESPQRIELRTPLVREGAFVSWWCRRDYDFMMAVGNQVTDEDLFHAMGCDNFMIRIGSARSSAAHMYLRCQADVLSFLTNLIEVNKEFKRLKHSIGLDRDV